MNISVDWWMRLIEPLRVVLSYNRRFTLGIDILNHIPGNTNHLYKICTTLAQRFWRWTNIVQMLYKCFVFAGITPLYLGWSFLMCGASLCPGWSCLMCGASLWPGRSCLMCGASALSWVKLSHVRCVPLLCRRVHGYAAEHRHRTGFSHLKVFNRTRTSCSFVLKVYGILQWDIIIAYLRMEKALKLSSGN